MAIILDPSVNRIILDSTNVSARAIYAAWVDWVSISDNAKYLPAFKTAGGEDLGSGLSIPPYYFLTNGWKVRPMESNQNLTITGNLFVDGGGVPVVSTLGIYQINVNYTVPIQAQGISTSGGSGPSASEIASQVRSELATELNQIMQIPTTSSGLSPSQATMLLSMYELLGLDPMKPLIVTDTMRSAGDIEQSISTSATETIVTRI